MVRVGQNRRLHCNQVRGLVEVYSLKNIKACFKKKQKCACLGCKVELDINDFERLDIDARGAVWRRDDRDGRLLRL